MMSLLCHHPPSRCVRVSHYGEQRVAGSALIHFSATAIKYNDIQGPPTKCPVAMATVGGFEQVVLPK